MSGTKAGMEHDAYLDTRSWVLLTSAPPARMHDTRQLEARTLHFEYFSIVHVKHEADTGSNSEM